MTTQAVEFRIFPWDKRTCLAKCCCSLRSWKHLQGNQRGRKVSRMTISGISRRANVIMSANGQNAVHFWRTLHLGLIKYLEAGRLRGSSWGSYSRPARHFRASLQCLESSRGGGGGWLSSELHSGEGAWGYQGEITVEIAGFSQPKLGLWRSEVLYEVRKQTWVCAGGCEEEAEEWHVLVSYGWCNKLSQT